MRQSTIINPHFTNEDLKEMYPLAMALIFSFFKGKFESTYSSPTHSSVLSHLASAPIRQTDVAIRKNLVS